MEVQGDHGLLVVNLENCIASGTSCELTEASSCVYTTTLPTGHETSVVQLAAPVQCIEPLQRIEHQHITHLQPVQYSQALTYDPNQHPSLYQPMTVTTAPLHHYATTNAFITNPPMSPSFPPLPMAVQPPPPDGAETTVEDNPEPTYPSEAYDYFLEIQNYLESQQYPPNVSNNYKTRLKKRALHYVMIEGKLHHNRKYPKEVIMRKEQQESMLSDIHVVTKTGVHLGVKKMFNTLYKKYFWRGMYTDVVTFVKKCNRCSDQSMAMEEEDSEEVEDPVPLSPSLMPQPTNNTSSIWNKVEVRLHGPLQKTSSHNEYVVTMADPISRWVCAEAIPTSDLPAHIAQFIFLSFCNYGFTRCSLVSCPNNLSDAVSKEYRSRVARLGDIYLSSVLACVDQQQASCGWVTQFLDTLVTAHPLEWDTHLHHFLFQYRTGDIGETKGIYSESPFFSMFGHSPLAFLSPDEVKENNPRYHLRRRRPYTGFIKCRQCDSLFSSKLAFRMHQQRKHFSGGRHKRCVLKRKHLKQTNHEWQPSDSWRESTVAAVKAVLEASREERRLRGNYHKYTVELQEQMAEYASQHGTQPAVRYFSERLGSMVSESTIRNLVKIHKAFTPALKEKIGQLAVNIGVEAASRTFSQLLKRDISQFLVQKFRTIYLKNYPNIVKEQQITQTTSNCAKSSNEMGNTPVKGKRYTSEMKEEIGQYACNHSVQETVQYFSKKLRMLVREQTVKHFQKSYLDKCQNQANEPVAKNYEPLLLESGDGVSLNTPVTLYQLNQPPSATVCYQSSPMPPPPPYPLTLVSTGYTVPPQGDLQPSMLVTEPSQSPLLSHFVTCQPLHQTILTILPEREVTKVASEQQDQDSAGEHVETQNYQITSPVVPEPLSLTHYEKEQEIKTDLNADIKKDFVDSGSGKTGQNKETKKKQRIFSKRGTYTAYSPEMRAEIGKYASEYGSVKACQHFAKILGHEVPESTVRGLREKYLKKMKHSPVTSLGYSQRGRPLMLGKYDELVQECLKDIVRSGEEVSTFLAITTAKEVVNKYEPDLLEENGGSLKLNITWAKSFLKRIGIHNNS